MRGSGSAARWVVASTVCLALAACGTTVPVSQQVAVGQDQGTGGPTDGLGGQAGGTSTGAGQSVGPGSQVDGSSSPTVGPRSTAAVQTPITRGTQGTGGQVSTGSARTPVEIGLAYTETGGVFLAAFGLNGTIADGRVYANAVLKYVNAHGGLAGHPVKPVYYNVELTRTDPYAVWMQEMCALWTQDHRVLGAQINANSDFTPLARCLDKKGALFDNASAWVRTQGDYQRYPRWVESRMLSAERLADEYVRVPAELGYFGKKPKIGMIAYDYPQSQELARLVTAALRRKGFDAPVMFTTHMGESTPELSGTIAAMQSAVLRFQAAGVTHVMSTAYPAALPFFMKYAQSQEYRPRYALTSYEGLVGVTANVPGDQLKDAVAVGWLPDSDVDPTRRPGFNTTARLCKKIFTAASIAAPDQPAGFGYCEFILMLHKAASGISPTALNGDTLLNAVNALGGNFASPATLATSLSRSQHDGVSAIRPVRFDSGCSCWTYAGPQRAVR
jgi:hypothetical protein